MFSTAPVPITPSFFPTRVPTINEFFIVSPTPSSFINKINPSLSPTNGPTKQTVFHSSSPPTHLRTREPSSLPTTIPTVYTTASKSPTPAPSFNPSQAPSFSQTQDIANKLSTDNSASTESSSQLQPSGIIAIVVVLFIMILLVVFFTYRVKNISKLKPHEIWRNYYDENKNTQNVAAHDIHHFYAKSNQDSSRPQFVPHVSKRLSIQSFDNTRPNSRRSIHQQHFSKINL